MNLSSKTWKSLCEKCPNTEFFSQQKRLRLYFFINQLSNWNFLVIFVFEYGKIITSITNVLDWLVWLFSKLLLYRTIASNVNGARMQKLHCSLTFCSMRFLLQIRRTSWEGRIQSLLVSIIFLPTPKHSDVYL